MEWYLSVLQRYAQFDGRARRKEYWMFALVNFGVAIVLAILKGVTGLGLFGLVQGLYLLGTLVPSLAVATRRLHDTDRSGWWLLLAFIPILGGIVLLVFLATDGQPGVNRFGPNPKALVAPVAGA